MDFNLQIEEIFRRAKRKDLSSPQYDFQRRTLYMLRHSGAKSTLISFDFRTRILRVIVDADGYRLLAGKDECRLVVSRRVSQTASFLALYDSDGNRLSSPERALG